MFRYRRRGILLVLGDPLPERTPLPKPAPINIIAKALEIRAYIEADPQRTFRNAAIRFKVTRARISQMMKIVETLPSDFIVHMGQCQNHNTLRRFSGKTLLKIAALDSPQSRKQTIDGLTEL